MKINVVKDYQRLSEGAAKYVVQHIQKTKDSVLGLPTGGTPLGMYQELVQLYKEGALDFSLVTTFNLDEYIGLAPTHPQSYHYYMQQQLFSHISICPDQTHVPRGDAEDLRKECERYEAAIDQAGGMDLVILGIGKNGHIGFNEPGTDPYSGTTIVNLTKSTIQANAKYFDDIDQVPKQAITMGLNTILEKSKSILMLASGLSKAGIIRQLLSAEEVDVKIPASLLKLHDNVTILLDQEAASYLPEQVLLP